MQKEKKIYIAGHRGMVGSAIWRTLEEKGYTNLIGRTSSELDLRNQQAVSKFFEEEKPDWVFLAAAKVGGILANNKYRADFLLDNLAIQNNIIEASYKSGVSKLLFLGSTCIYPKHAPQPMPEDSLLTSPLEYTNEPYAIAKIAGIKLCESFNLQHGTNFLSVMPTNLYGPGDNFDLDKSHVLPALLRKMHLAKLWKEGKTDALLSDLGMNSIDEATSYLESKGVSKERVAIWGTGEVFREFLWSEELAKACLFVMENLNFEDLAKNKTEIRNTHLNIGSGEEISIKALAEKVKEVVGYSGELYFDTSKPDGTPRKLTDNSALKSLGWENNILLDEGLQLFYEHYLQSESSRRQS